jgi:NAD(P)H-dependent flavin oxidoreductase YrpB (nitropropane dioxygenase family)
MATKPNTVKKQKNGNLTRNGKTKLKSLSEGQLVDLVNKGGSSKNVTSKVGKSMAKLLNALKRKQTVKLMSA